MNKKLYISPSFITINLDFESSLLEGSQEDNPRITVYRRGRETQDDYEEDDTMW